MFQADHRVLAYRRGKGSLVASHRLPRRRGMSARTFSPLMAPYHGQPRARYATLPVCSFSPASRCGTETATSSAAASIVRAIAYRPRALVKSASMSCQHDSRMMFAGKEP